MGLFILHREKIVDAYNMGAINIEQHFQILTELITDLQKEEKRHVKEGLTEQKFVLDWKKRTRTRADAFLVRCT